MVLPPPPRGRRHFTTPVGPGSADKLRGRQIRSDWTPDNPPPFLGRFAGRGEWYENSKKNVRKMFNCPARGRVGCLGVCLRGVRGLGMRWRSSQAGSGKFGESDNKRICGKMRGNRPPPLDFSRRSQKKVWLTGKTNAQLPNTQRRMEGSIWPGPGINRGHVGPPVGSWGAGRGGPGGPGRLGAGNTPLGTFLNKPGDGGTLGTKTTSVQNSERGNFFLEKNMRGWVRKKDKGTINCRCLVCLWGGSGSSAGQQKLPRIKNL